MVIPAEGLISSYLIDGAGVELLVWKECYIYRLRKVPLPSDDGFC